MAIPKIVGYVKMNAAKRINDFRNMRSVPVWQRGYYDRIIRNEQELFETRKYILENPLKWQEDPENIDMQALEQFM
jgi:hypothetical protein